MAKVSLRLYNREIESLIDHNQIDEAIAHCKFILQSYPKHIETYRLLGNAYLEKQHYEEASDVYQRVLASLPDDFVPLVGMSIIREYESDLNGAIWFMERAFEIQPSNSAVQDELRRLIERRDGIKPIRIRMTRGALARMYAKGDLYQQSIAEIHAILANDSNRPDLQVLLARMCFQTGQKIEATEICSELLNKYPYCLEANRLLSQILPETSRAEDVKIYLQRIYALDPYLAVQNNENLSIKNASENSITLDRLDYKPGYSNNSDKGTAWSNEETTISSGEIKNEPIPGWISDLEKTILPINEEEQSGTPPSEVADSSEKEELIPGWMKSVGWTESKNESGETLSSTQELPNWINATEGEKATSESPAKSEEPSSFFNSATIFVKMEDQSQTIEEAHLTPVEEIPDWLKSLEPPKTVPEESIGTNEVVSEGDNLSISDQNLPDWLKELKNESPLKSDSGLNDVVNPVEENIKASNEIEPVPSSSMDEFPDWLKSLEPEIISDSKQPSSQEITNEESEESLLPVIEIPGWLKELGKQPVEQNNELVQTPLPSTNFVSSEAQIETDASDIAPITIEEEDFTKINDRLNLISNIPNQEKHTEEPLVSPISEIKSDIEEVENIHNPPDSPVTSTIQQPENLLPKWLQGLDENEPDQTIKPDEIGSTWTQEIQGNKEDQVIDESALKIEKTEEKFILQPEKGLENKPAFENTEIAEGKTTLLSIEGINGLMVDENTGIREEEDVTTLPPESLLINPISEKTENDQKTTALPPTESFVSKNPVEYIKNPEEASIGQTMDWLILLQAAQTALAEGDVESAINGYSQLINHQIYLNEVIKDLEGASSRFATNVSLLITLGDAYTRANQLQDALNAYFKAEEILR